MMIVREPVVAGQFYPRNREEIIESIKMIERDSNLNITMNNRQLIGGISPHAGYIFSLKHMVPLFKLIREDISEKRRIFLLNPNHRGRGASLSIDSHTHWKTPMGMAEVDDEAVNYLINHNLGAVKFVSENLAQNQEHSAEVLIPLLLYYLKEIKFIPLSMKTFSFDMAYRLASLIKQLENDTGMNSLIIASSDFNHFNTPQKGRELDDLALEPLMNFDTKAFFNTVRDYDISICGYAPIIVLLEYAKLISSKPQAILLSRGHSGESEYYKGRVPQEVVNYISLAVYK